MRTEFWSEAILTDVLCILKALDLWNFPQYCIVWNRVNESSRRGDVTAKAAAEWWTGAGSNHILKALPSKERENFVTVWKCLITRSEFGKSFKSESQDKNIYPDMLQSQNKSGSGPIPLKYTRLIYTDKKVSIN